MSDRQWIELSDGFSSASEDRHATRHIFLYCRKSIWLDNMVLRSSVFLFNFKVGTGATNTNDGSSSDTEVILFDLYNKLERIKKLHDMTAASKILFMMKSRGIYTSES